ncbi:delta-aminolevulinic acid dehydratase [Cylas formicarius]|uniref:delta-aminolevulinic acid dehydratase n=1 Tax=Cylas formicarius TaxID=197179 RepID=UPI002958BDF6|nr:delta-aminolevulinic acid dehydratase [Cylas formicarius]
MSEVRAYSVKRNRILQSGIFNETLRGWQSSKCDVTAKNLMYPVFITENDDDEQDVPSMPGVKRYGVDKLRGHLEPLVRDGLLAILVFGVVDNLPKNESGDGADRPDNPVVRALPKLRRWFPDLTVACDVCLCPYTSHGHCAILHRDGTIDNDASVERIAQIALAYAKAGAHIVAPSDMMDGRVGAIKQTLVDHKLGNVVSVLSYSCKFASAFYGPFREAAKSSPAFGDRKRYQLPPDAAGIALRAAARDVAEGADMLMVKPIMAYADVLKQVKDQYPEYPVFVYQVSGEFAMIYNAARDGIFRLQDGLMEILRGYRRAGADVIITYYAPQILDWIRPKHKL